MERIKKLIEELNTASKAYYQNDKQIISDYEYDRLYDELVSLEKETSIIYPNSPTSNVGYNVLSQLKKVKHDKKILSLDKTKELSKLREWLGDQEGLISWKLDGLTIVLTYKNGELLQAITRGNGEIGEDVTHNALVFSNLPRTIPFKGDLVLRGEGIISFSSFLRINEELIDGEIYKNPRNLCSGTVRLLNNELVKRRNVEFYAFSVGKANNVQFDNKKSNELSWLNSLGFSTVLYELVNKDTIEEAVVRFELQIPKNDFGSDGLVLTYNDISFSQSLGETAKFPKDSIAFKWKDETAETILREIIWNTSRTGSINPIAVFDSVELEGTTVNRASVHNVSVLEELQLGIGDTIRVYKANMIIPQIAENITKSGTVIIPSHCFVCDGLTEIHIQNEGKTLYCTNPNCAAQKLRGLTHFVSRNAMNVDGLSIETLEKFIDFGFINDYTDIFLLENYQQEITSMKGFGEKSYENLITSINNSKHVLLYQFIYALGINQIGLSNAKLLCRHYNNDFNSIKSATIEELIVIDGFGEIIASNLVSYFNDEKNLYLLNKALDHLEFIKEKNTDSPQSLLGLTFVITGDLFHFKNRKELTDIIESLGGKATSAVTKKTTCLINNDVSSPSSKNKKAAELNIPILNEADFIKEYKL